MQIGTDLVEKSCCSQTKAANDPPNAFPGSHVMVDSPINATKSPEPPLSYPGPTPDADTQKPALPEPPYEPYAKPAVPEPLYEPYKGI